MNDSVQPTASPAERSRLPHPPRAPSSDAEVPIASLRDELIACQRLATLGTMMAIITHEFNNLLTPLMARAEAALSGALDVAYMRKTLERTLVQTQRALAVTEHVLDMAHDRPRSMRVCSVAGAVHEAVETMIRPFEKDGIDLQVAVPEDLHVDAHEHLLCQLLVNLLLNARQAMTGVRGPLSVSAVERNGHVEIEVRDSGKGIPHEVLNQVVNPFLASDPRARPNDWQQVGLGLSVCRLIAHEHGATIQAFLNEGRGCTFRVSWPVVAPGGASGKGRC